jgi:arylsulfatase A-like enzyme
MGQNRYWIILIGILCLVISVGQTSGPLQRAAAASRPNVLIIVTDDQRSGLQVMPNTRSWMQAGGTRFDNAYVTTPTCCPSRASIFTGRYTHNHRVLGNHGEGRDLVQESTLQYYLHQAGYETAMYGKYMNSWDITQPPPYFDRYSMTIRSHFYTGGTWNVNGTVKTLPDYNVSYIGRRAEHFLRSVGTQNSWFLYLATAAPHSPFTPQRMYADAVVPPWNGDPAVFETDRSDKPPYVRATHAGLRRGRYVRRAQFRTLMSVDRLVAKMFNTLRDLRETRNTLVFLISDNGLMWAEHGLEKKGVPYEQAIHVPMLARWPGHFPANARDHRVAANIDIAPTVLQATGIVPNPSYPIDGRSLLGPSSLRTRLLTEYFVNPLYRDSPQGNWASTRTKAYKYTEYYGFDGTTVTYREYYNLRTDPWELHNLLGDSDPANDPDVAALHLQLAQDRVCQGTSGPSACP